MSGQSVRGKATRTALNINSGLRCPFQPRHLQLFDTSVSRVNQVDVRPSTRLSSDSLRSPTALAGHVIGPALAAIQQVIALGNQSLVQLAGEQGNALRYGVMPE